MAKTKDQPVVCIGGVSGGIGSSLAKILASRHWTVSGYCRHPEKAGSLDQAIDADNIFGADATDSGAVQQTFDKVVEKLGRVDAYVHCIGSVLLKAAHMINDGEWSKTLRLNLDSAFYSLRSAVQQMQKQGGGSIVLVSSVAAQTGMPAHEAIGAAKGGINGLVLSAAATYANRGIRVNAVAPGLVETGLSKPILGSEQARNLSERMHPLGRIGKPEDVAHLIAYLVSEEASWITGEIWSVDGGMAHVRQRPKG